MKAGISFLLLIVSFSAWAQEDVNVSAVPQSSAAPKSEYDSIRSTYIKPFPDHFFIWPVVKQRRFDFEMQRISNKKDAFSFKSNKPFSVGFGMYLFELGVEIVFAVPLKEQSKAIYGESHTRDYQLNTFGKRWGAEAYYQKYRGFYIDDLTGNIPANTPYPQRPDIETRNVGAMGNYILNSKKFSFKSVYNFGERQLKSAGTFVAFAALNGFMATGDSSLLGSEFEERFGDDAYIREIKINTLAVAPGYAYNLIYRGFFLHGTLALGPAHNWISFTRGNNTSHASKIDLFTTVRVSMGYNGDRFFGGLTFITQSRTGKFEEAMISSTNTSFKILLGYRMKEFGFLKKRIWDIPKAIFK